MQEPTDVATINDIQQLKAMKADQYDERERSIGVTRQTEQNITIISNRIAELEIKEAEAKNAETQKSADKDKK